LLLLLRLRRKAALLLLLRLRRISLSRSLLLGRRIALTFQQMSTQLHDRLHRLTGLVRIASSRLLRPILLLLTLLLRRRALCAKRQRNHQANKEQNTYAPTAAAEGAHTPADPLPPEDTPAAGLAAAGAHSPDLKMRQHLRDIVLSSATRSSPGWFWKLPPGGAVM
jgi:hypothetical protein